MKHLKDIVVESFFDVEPDDSKQFEKGIKDEIKQFLGDTYGGASKCKISKKPNEDGKYVVDCRGDLSTKNAEILSLTNGNFVFGEVRGDFRCYYCRDLTSLEGSPEKVGMNFSCEACNSLTSLKGAPKEVGGRFDCSYCNALISLEGVPKEVGGSFDCSYCNALISLEGAPKEVGGRFDCRGCQSLTSLKGAPKKVNRNFDCRNAGQKFDEKEIQKHVSYIGGKIFA